MDLLRFCTIGSVDDGKSTLIGRLLHDTRQLFDDQLDAMAEATRRRGMDGVELAFATDGLKAEREQGITIDVAYRYAATPRRKFVIADCPGHVQYTANMATGASTARVAVVVVDAERGLREQTRRHVCIASLMGVSYVIVAVNKMDLVGWSEDAFIKVQATISTLASKLGIEPVVAIPVSALWGDNVVEGSTLGAWYSGPTLLEALVEAPVGTAGTSDGGTRLPVQWVLRARGGGRAYAGMVSGGPLRVGEEITVLPSGQRTIISGISIFGTDQIEAAAGLSVSVTLHDDLDVSRGDLIASASNPPSVLTEMDATLCWFSEIALTPGARYEVKHTTRRAPVLVSAIRGRLNVNTMNVEEADELRSNDIGIVALAFASGLSVDNYRSNRSTGSFVVVDPFSYSTLGAGMVGDLST